MQDEKVEVSGQVFVVDRGLARRSGSLTVDYRNQGPYPGFRITPEKYPEVSCSC